jgi:hypothetical protein
MSIEGIVQQLPGLRLLLKVGEEIDQRELDPLCQRGDGGDHIGADGVLPGGSLQKPSPAVGHSILSIHLALRRNVQQDRQDARRPAEVVKLGEQHVEGLPFGGGQELLGGALRVPIAEHHRHQLRADPDDAEIGMDLTRRHRTGLAR